MKLIATGYFLLSGLLFALVGAHAIASGAHVGSAFVQWIQREQFEAIVAGDADKAATIKMLRRELMDGMARVSHARYYAGVVLLAFGVLHFALSAILFARSMQVKASKKRAQQASG